MDYGKNRQADADAHERGDARERCALLPKKMHHGS
jgi:hypothetical protein